MPYEQSWQITGTSGKEYKVSEHSNGWYACECPAWKFARNNEETGRKKDCQHILQVRMQIVEAAAAVPDRKRVRSKKSLQVEVSRPKLMAVLTTGRKFREV